MSTRTSLGRIKRASFGYGGYQDAMFGLSLEFGGQSWGCSTFIGGWGIERSDYAKWSEEERQSEIFKAAWKLKETLDAARKTNVVDLVGIPVECTFNGLTLSSWRVLTEVLDG